MSETIRIDGIDHIQCEVADLETSSEFWRERFGFAVRQVGIRAGKRWTILSAGRVLLSLHEDKPKSATAAAGIRITHFGLVVDDFMAARTRLVEAGVRIEPVDRVIEYDDSRSFYFYDPNGHKVEVSERWGGGLV